MIFNNDMAYVVGTIEGDGWIHPNEYRLGLTVKDKDFATEFKNRLIKIGINTPHLFYNKNRTWTTSLFSKEVYSYIKNFNKKNILKSSKVCKLQFLKGLYDSDGGVVAGNLDKLHKSVRQVHLTSNRKILLKFVQKLLKEFNIISKIYTRINKGFSKGKTYYVLRICGRDNLTKYSKLIGFSIKRKNNMLKQVLDSYVFDIDFWNKRYGGKNRTM